MRVASYYFIGRFLDDFRYGKPPRLLAQFAKLRHLEQQIT
jgi:hypothetical protein